MGNTAALEVPAVVTGFQTVIVGLVIGIPVGSRSRPSWSRASGLGWVADEISEESVALAIGGRRF